MKGDQVGFWYRVKNWFRVKPGLGEPLRFLCGSEEELRRVTTWVSHLYYCDRFEVRGKWVVHYYATMKEFKQRIEIGPGTIWHDCLPENIAEQDEYRLVLRVCQIVFNCNPFSGTQWKTWGNYQMNFDNCLQTSNRPGLPRLLRIGENPYRLRVEVTPPSAHERAEALLALSEWLDGKVSEQEKRELLRLPEDVKT